MIENQIKISLLITGLISTGLILNQNETAKDSNISSVSRSSNIESLTWLVVLLELFLLLLMSKTNN
jgi:hypothetical protein